MIRNLTAEEYKKEKIRLIKVHFSPYNNRNGDEYIVNEQISKDKIKNRIDFQMYKNLIPNDSQIGEDVYQDLFENLLKLNEKNTKKLVDSYYQNPNSFLHFCYYLIKIKNFSVDKKYPNKPNSSAKKMMFGSSFNYLNSEIKSQADLDFDGFDDGWNEWSATEPEEDTATVNQLVLEAMTNELSPGEIELFHTLARDTKSIKKTKDKQIEILQLKIKIKEIRAKILNQMTEKEQYDELLKLEDKLLFFNQFNEVTLEQGDFEILEKLYRVYFSKFSIFNKTCNSCVKELLHICISRYSILKKQFEKVTEVEDPKEPEQNEEEKLVEKPKPVKKTKKK